jgi:hypothetical protein
VRFQTLGTSRPEAFSDVHKLLLNAESPRRTNNQAAVILTPSLISCKNPDKYHG